MATYIKTLKEDNGDTTYPQTVSDAVFVGQNTLTTELAGYVTAEDYAVSDPVTPAIGTAMLQDGAVTADKIDFTDMVRSTQLTSQAFIASNDTVLSLALPAGKWKVTTEVRGFFSQTQDTTGAFTHCGMQTTTNITQVGNTARPHETFVDIVEPSAQTTYSLSAGFGMTWSIDTKMVAERIG